MEEAEPCYCLIACDISKICLKTVRCDCYDFAILGNLCKHVHFISLNQQADTNQKPLIEEIDGIDEHDNIADLIVETDERQMEIETMKSLFLSQTDNQLNWYVGSKPPLYPHFTFFSFYNDPNLIAHLH